MTRSKPHPVETASPHNVTEQVSREGYFRSAANATLDEFRTIAQEFGEAFYEADVRIGAARPRNYQLPAAIDFHTDHVSAEIAAWYCIERECSGGSMQFLDLAPIAATLTDGELGALERVGVPDNAVWAEGGEIPLCTATRESWAFHYVPWFDLRCPDDEAKAALDKFEAGVRRAKLDSVIEIDLQEGQFVFVDNHRLMHGRAAIPADSRRHLKRLWIRSTESAEKAA